MACMLTFVRVIHTPSRGGAGGLNPPKFTSPKHAFFALRRGPRTWPMHWDDHAHCLACTHRMYTRRYLRTAPPKLTPKSHFHPRKCSRGGASQKSGGLGLPTPRPATPPPPVYSHTPAHARSGSGAGRSVGGVRSEGSVRAGALARCRPSAGSCCCLRIRMDSRDNPHAFPPEWPGYATSATRHGHPHATDVSLAWGRPPPPTLRETGLPHLGNAVFSISWPPSTTMCPLRCFARRCLPLD